MNKFIPWDSLEFKKHRGVEKVKCPICDSIKQRKGDTPIQINHVGGFGKCFRCEALTFKDSIKTETEVKYTLPTQTWSNYTKLSDKLVKWIEETRKIKQFTLNELSVTEELYYQPALQKEVNNIVFNYFEGATLVNKKYRSANKHFTQSKNGKPIFYNINSVLNSESVYIVEGEFDVLAISQIGIKNVISVPNGANDNDAYWLNSEPYLKDVKKFYIAVDNDEKGNDLAEKIAQRLGRYRCERVNFEGKDANDDLISGVLEKTIYNTSKYPVSGTFTSEDMLDKMMSLYDKGLPPTLEFKNSDLTSLNSIFKLMLGHLVVVTGIPSHGKSNFTEWMVLNLLLENDFKASFFSPEHQPLELHMSSFVSKVIGKDYFREIDNVPRCSKNEVLEFASWSKQKLYLTSPENGNFANWDWIFEKFTEQMFIYGINIFIIDAYNKVEHTGNKSERENITKILSRLTQFAQTNNVLILLVAHPTKMQIENGVYRSPTLYDVSGSADFRNQTHDGFSIYRYFDSDIEDGHVVFTNLKTKYSFQGSIGGKAEFEYHRASGRFFQRGTIPNTQNLLKSLKTAENDFKELITVEPKDAFDEIPF
jgi:twinkle protein